MSAPAPPFNGPPRGLDALEARARLELHGPNTLPSTRPRTLRHAVMDVLREPMFLLLGCGAALYFVVGEPGDAFALLVSVLLVVGITLVQERRTAHALDALRDLASPRALVLRGGARLSIDARELVPGDLMLLSEGSRVPADGIVLQARNLQLDESLLTGESAPARKNEAPPEQAVVEDMPEPGGELPCHVFSGTLVVDGQGSARALRTGAGSAIGRIGDSLTHIDDAPTPLQQYTRRTVRRLAVVVLAVAVCMVLTLGLARGDWREAALAGIAWAMGLLPEELPVVLTVFLALGAWRISRHKVLARNMPALETLGATSVLCVDKTGTLTENRMRVDRLVGVDAAVHVRASARDAPVPPAFEALARCARLASRPNPFDPMEKAIHALGGDAAEEQKGSLLHEYPLTPELLALTCVWQPRGTGECLVAAKGAPEAIAALCHLPVERAQWLHDEAGRLGRQGLRVLGVASARHAAGPLPDSPRDFRFEFLGLLALADPVREEVPAAIAQCRAAGIRVVMITGDHPDTARSIAAQAGIDTTASCLTGADVDRLDDAQLRERLRTAHVVARAVPRHKLRIMLALQGGGEVVAMIGDGVNDAPALRGADIGVAMGGRGTDVAREAADLIITDDRFSSLVATIRLGRRIYTNLTRASGYIVAVHVPIAVLALLPVLTGWPLVLLPIHIALLELLIDPACSIAFEAEAEEPDTMRKPPRARRASLFGDAGIGPWVRRGLLIAAASIGVYAWAREHGYTEEQLRAAALAVLLFGNAALILGARARSTASAPHANPALWIAMAAGPAALGIILAWPALRELFHLALPPIVLGTATALLVAGLCAGFALFRQKLTASPGVVRRAA